LVEKRKFIIVGCFFVAMFVTPPDALSMIMLAIPMWLLFEIGLFFGKLIEKSSRLKLKLPELTMRAKLPAFLWLNVLPIISCF
jgi:Sec-independent protein secretion pathway component TatC